MGKHYISCARCNKDMDINTSFDCYSSDIDHQLVCRECWQKEQPKELFNKIADLEAKLADKETELNKLQEYHDKYPYSYSEEYMLYNKALKQQLAEKEEEIERLKQEQTNYFNFGAGCQKVTIKTIDGKIADIYHDKNYNAIKQLERVKEYISKELEYMWNNNAEMTCRDRNIIDGIYKEIDNLISELKEQE